MLICNNCFSENADGTLRCHQCNMEGNFTYQIAEGNPLEAVALEKKPFQCVNCGCETPGQEAKCVHCHFPLQSPTRNMQNGNTFIPGNAPDVSSGIPRYSPNP
ncbi:MAG: hypothetical protein D6730_19615 [Bacteroidetes bacterium]|nr:MAG: hypothetical protein D6730_19615 [Bacteroidota bacterium]